MCDVCTNEKHKNKLWFYGLTSYAHTHTHTTRDISSFDTSLISLRFNRNSTISIDLVKCLQLTNHMMISQNLTQYWLTTCSMCMYNSYISIEIYIDQMNIDFDVMLYLWKWTLHSIEWPPPLRTISGSQCAMCNVHSSKYSLVNISKLHYINWFSVLCTAVNSL